MKCKQLGLKASQIPKKNAYLGGIQNLVEINLKSQRLTREMIKTEILSLFKEYLHCLEMDIIRKEEHYWYALVVAKLDKCNQSFVMIW